MYRNELNGADDIFDSNITSDEVYTPGKHEKPPILDIDPAIKNLNDFVKYNQYVVLDPSLLPFLSVLLENSKKHFKIPPIIFQLFTVAKEGISPVSLPGVPGDQQASELGRVAATVLEIWTQTNNISLRDIRESLQSDRCSPTIITSDIGFELYRTATVDLEDAYDVHIEGIGTDLISKILGQLLAGAFDEELPIIGKNIHGFTKKAVNTISTVVLGGIHSFLKLKEETMTDLLGEWVVDHAKELRFIGIVIGISMQFLPTPIPPTLSLMDIGLVVLDP